eukprot:TRINITY_DN34007_c0_g1_i1.p1 TRINITY_DN34007_c0_g1~~TRINITY_DN34007_c0_g1_i1.p1  ORF type:complete len:876 (+),score=201.17 TRINITY_DN34007_c0_g1_i1:79-2706(+)
MVRCQASLLLFFSTVDLVCLVATDPAAVHASIEGKFSDVVGEVLSSLSNTTASAAAESAQASMVSSKKSATISSYQETSQDNVAGSSTMERSPTKEGTAVENLIRSDYANSRLDEGVEEISGASEDTGDIEDDYSEDKEGEEEEDYVVQAEEDGHEHEEDEGTGRAWVRKQEVTSDFSHTDAVGSGFLERGEMVAFLNMFGTRPQFNSRHFDEGDDEEANLESNSYTEAERRPISENALMDHFELSDVDGSGFLERNEVLAMLEASGAPEGYNWIAFDTDGDQRLSRNEFFIWARHLEKSVGLDSYFDADHVDENEDLEATSATAPAEELAAARGFQRADSNHDGFLDEGEVAAVLKNGGLPRDFDWLPHVDKDKDGRVSPREYLEWAFPSTMVRKGEIRDNDTRSSLLSRGKSYCKLRDEGTVPKQSDLQRYDTAYDGSIPEAEFRDRTRSRVKVEEDEDAEEKARLLEVRQGNAEEDAPAKDVDQAKHYEDEDNGVDEGQLLEEFKAYDVDGSALLEIGEVSLAWPHQEAVPEHASKRVDVNRKSTSSQQGLVDLTHEASPKEQVGMQQREAAEHAVLLGNNGFLEFDANSDCLLEPTEPAVFFDAFKAPLDFDWQMFDLDRDGTISREEFAKWIARVVVKDSQNDDVIFKSFHDHDVDGSGFLDIGEVSFFVRQHEVSEKEEDFFATLDSDSDARISPQEFMDWARDEEDKTYGVNARQTTSPSEREAAFRTAVGGEFAQADVDDSGFLEEGEINAMLTKVAFPGSYEWQADETDKDGRVSREELVNLASQTQPVFARVADVDADFDDFDADGSGFLEKEEVLGLLKDSGAKEGSDWSHFDHNGDGKISRVELQHWAQLIEDSLDAASAHQA